MKNKENKGNKTIVIYISIILALVVVGFGICIVTDIGLFGVKNGTLKPIDQYTLLDYENMSEDERHKFEARFETDEDFDEWLTEIIDKSMEDIPWEKGGKNPDSYTLEEYEKLDSTKKIAFSEWFNNSEEFDKWFTSAQGK